MSFRQVCLLISFLFYSLFVTLLILPDLVFWLFNVQGNDAGDFFARRAAMLFLGLGTVGFCARDTASSEVKCLVAIAVGAAMGGLAILGLVELFRGYAGFGILVAVIIEIILVGLCYQQWRENRSAL